VNPLPYFSWEIDISSAETHFNKQQGFKLKALSFESEKKLFPLLMLSSSWIKIVTQRSKKNQQHTHYYNFYHNHNHNHITDSNHSVRE